MSDESDRALSFKERQELFKAKLNLSPQLPSCPPAKSPILPPRRLIPNDISLGPPPLLPPRNPSIDNGSRRSLQEDKPPELPPRRPSVSSEGASHSQDEAPFVHVSERKNTRKAVRLKKNKIQDTIRSSRDTQCGREKQLSTSSPPPASRSPSPASRASSPDTLKRGESSPNSTIKRAPSPENLTRNASPETLTRERSTATVIKRSLSPAVKRDDSSENQMKSPITLDRTNGGPPNNGTTPQPTVTVRKPVRPAPTPPSPFSTIKRASAVVPNPPCHRQSMPPSLLPPPPPLLSNRRHSYDERIEIDKAAVKAKQDNPQEEEYQYARRTSQPPPKPPNESPYRVHNKPSPSSKATTKRSRTSICSSIYMVDVPPDVNISTHPKFTKDTDQTSSRVSSTSSSPSTHARRTSSPLTYIRGVPGQTPPPIPKTLPPPLDSNDTDKKKRSMNLQAAEDCEAGPNTQLGLLEDDQSEYEDDDDIYGQIAADLDDITYEQGQDFFIIQKSVTAPPTQQTKSGFREYWHERKEVIESGILETDELSKTERARQEAMYEIFTTEETYRKSLETLDKQFISDNLFSCYLDEFPGGPKSILSNIEEIMTVSDRLLEELRTLYDRQVTVESITSILRRFADDYFPAFVTYCTNTANQQDMLSRHRAEDLDFEKFLTDREVCLHGQNLNSYLILPMQRICRMPLLLDAINKKTDQTSPDKIPLTSLYEDICEIVEKCNEGVRRAETRKKMENLDRKCDFSKVKLKSFSEKADRLIIKDGVGHILKFKSGKMMGSKINMWLLTDYFVIGVNDPKDETKIILTECSPRQLVKVSPHFMPPSSYKKKIESDRIFHLQLLSPDKKFIVQSQSPNEKDKWMEVLNKKDTVNEDETIYEEWDVPIVQAKHHYEKTNEDDLELTKGEIYRVLKKYTDGWCFGERQSDGVKGWFPMSYTVEIDSDHTKYREILRKQQLLEKIVSNEKSTMIFSTMRKT